MTEQKWLKSIDPRAMLKFLLLGMGSDRKFRLFACASCRRVWSCLQEPVPKLVEEREQLADAKLSQKELRKLEAEFWPKIGPMCWPIGENRAVWAAEVCLRVLINSVTEFVATGGLASATFMCFHARQLDHSTSLDNVAVGKAASAAELRELAGVLREIFGNPFRPVAIDPRWLTSTVIDLATVIYQERSFEKMPILADALMDAGCDDEEIINHCHSAGQHVLGCWVVDLILGKS